MSSRRLLALAPVLLLVAVVVGHGLWLWWWFSVDGHPARAVCCDLSGEAARAVARAARADLPGVVPWAPRETACCLSSARASSWRPHPDAFAWVSGLSLLLLCVVLFDLGRQLAGPWAGLLAAALAPLVPALAAAGRRWDAQGPLGLLVALGVAAIVRSASLTRPGPTVAVAAVGAAMVAFSPRETDNLLALGALLAVAGASAARGLARGRGPPGVRLARPRVLIGGVVVLVGVSAAAWWLLSFTSPEGVAYYWREAAGGASPAGAPGGAAGRLAYLGHLLGRALTAPLAIPFEIAVVLVLLRGRGRAEVGAWLLLPLLALSLLPKRNFYYLSVIWPALPLALALGVAALPGRGRWAAGLRSAVGVALVAVGLHQLSDRTALRPTNEAAVAAQRRWMAGDDRWGGAFQTSDQHLTLAPRPAPWLEPAAQALADAVPVDPCRCRAAALMNRSAAAPHLALAVLPHQPCLELRAGERGPRGVPVVARVTEARRGESPEGFAVAATVDGPDGPLLVWTPADATECVPR